MSRTALDGFPLGDVETPVKSASLVFFKELNGVKRFGYIRISQLAINP